MKRLGLIGFFLFISCNQTKSTEVSEVSIFDSMRYRVQTLGNWEQSEWNFFQELESEIKRREKNITEDEINHYIQDMIDNGLKARPMLFLESEEGTKFESVDYVTYKKYRLTHPIDSMRLFTVSNKLSKEDSLEYSRQDSLRNELIKILASEQNK